MKVIRLLIVIFILSGAAACGSDGFIPMDDSWKISYTDKNEYKEKDYNDSAWETITLPVQTNRDVTVVWIRKQFKVPDSLKNEPLSIYLGKIIDTDIVYINGFEIGRSGKEPPEYIPMWNYNRRYNISPFFLNRDGENIIAIRSYAAYDPKFADLPVIGKIEDVHRLTTSRNIKSRYLPMTTGMMIFILGVFGTIMFMFSHRNKNLLLFGMVGILWGFLSIHYYNHNFGIYYNLKEKIYFSLMAVEIALIYFLLQKILDIRSRVLEAAVFILTISTMAVCFSHPLHEHMYGQGYTIIGILAITEQLMWGYLIIKALLLKKSNAFIAGAGYLLFMAGVIHDSLAITGLYIIEVYFVTFSYPALLASFAFIFIRDYSVLEERLKFMDAIAAKNTIITSQKRELENRNIDLENDLKLARSIQEDFIPRDMPGKHIHALYRPMEEIGGDFYKFIYFDDPDLTGIFISDVSGHGAPAALITAMMKGYLDQAGALLNDPAGLMRYLNDSLLSISGMYFVTAFYGIFNKKNNEFRYINSGHTVPFVILDSTVSSLMGRRSVPLGIFPGRLLSERGRTFCDNTVVLVRGSRVLFYTDGLTEARNEADPYRYFETTGLLPVMMRAHKGDVSHFIEEIYSELVKFKGNEIFEDDVCMICMDVS
jgi:serine phosphatase RsbU (regulator of sigma subunit)/predicted small lipoprotein YifL